MRIGFLAFLAALLAPTLSAAATWQSSFDPAAVGTYLGGADSVLVAGGGEASDELKQAVSALADALRQSKRARSVMTGEAIGPIADLDDQAIVKKAGHLPATSIAVVRIFPAGAGEEPTAVVAFYSKKGEPSSAFSVQRGQPLAGAMVGSGAGQGATEKAVVAVNEVQKTGPVGNGGAKEEYEKAYVWFEDYVAVNQYGTPVNSWSVAYKGKYKQPLPGGELYRELGRSDLAAQYEDADSSRSGLLVGGILGMTVAAPLLLGLGMYGIIEHSDGAMMAGLGGGSVVFLAGTVMLIAGAATDPNPVTPSEARQMVDEHNKKLKQKLGLPMDASRQGFRTPQLTLNFDF